jgi:60 kDa SS-A/Ro ribonucleoprotein
MNKIAQHIGDRVVVKNKNIKSQTPQTVPISKEQVRNSPGGFVFKVGNWDQLQRFISLGTAGGTYYIKENALTKLNYDVVLDCLAEDGARVIREIVRISEGGLAPKNDFAILTLAIAAAKGDEETKRLAYEALPRVCRIATHLFQFLEDSKSFRGRGNGFNRAIARWYTNKSVDDRAYQMVKYRNRNNWSHRDVLRTVRIKPENNADSALYAWAVKGEWTSDMPKPRVIEGFEKVQAATTVKEVVSCINDYRLTWEALPTQFLKEKSVWEALLPHMLPTALIRNLGNMSSAGVFDTGEFDNIATAVSTLTSAEKLQKGKVHPLQAVIAQLVYRRGCGDKGSNIWKVNEKIVDGLNDAFYASMKTITPTGKKILLGVDESASMSYQSGVTGLNCAQAAAVMVLAEYVSEPNCIPVFFDTTYREVSMSKNMTLEKAKQLARNGGGTDLGQPIQYALDKKIAGIDAFVIFTDNETYGRNPHSMVLFNEYKNVYNKDVKLIICSMAANMYTVGDPNDTSILQVFGLDASLPNIINSYLSL